MDFKYLKGFVLSFLLFFKKIEKRLSDLEITGVFLQIVFKTPIQGIENIDNKHFREMAYLREYQAFQNRPSPYVIAGDSIIHIGEKRFEKLVFNGYGLKCQGIGGDNVDTFLQHYRETIVPLQPEYIALHIGGNNFVGLSPAAISGDYVYNALDKIFKALFDEIPTLKKIGYLTVIPLGDPKTSIVGAIRDRAELLEYRNGASIPLFHDLLKNSKWAKLRKVDIIDIRSNLEDKRTRFVKSEYSLPDSIHLNDLAYTEIIVPVVDDWFRKMSKRGLK